MINFDPTQVLYSKIQFFKISKVRKASYMIFISWKECEVGSAQTFLNC